MVDNNLDLRSELSVTKASRYPSPYNAWANGCSLEGGMRKNHRVDENNGRSQIS
jgi:hypothetical protein